MKKKPVKKSAFKPPAKPQSGNLAGKEVAKLRTDPRSKDTDFLAGMKAVKAPGLRD